MIQQTNQSHSETHTRLVGHWLLLARLTLAAVTILTSSILIASVLARLLAADELHPSGVPPGWTLEALTVALAQLGLSTSFFVIYNFLVAHILWLGFLLIGGLVFWHKSDDWLALLMALMLMTFPISVFNMVTLLDKWPGFRLPIQWVSTLGTLSFLPFFLLFPDGRFVPRLTRFVAAAWVIMVLLATLFPKSWVDPDNWPPTLSFLFQATFLGVSVFTQIYRYRHLSSPLARQQTKWLVFSISVLAFILLGYSLIGVLDPPLTQPGVSGLVYYLASWPPILCYLMIPLSLAIGMLRYHLWDIDIIIRRTLIYTIFSLLLALVYFGSVVLLEQLFQRSTGQGERQWVIVLATLAIAALFNPLRHRVQAEIDRRFYRRKYNAEQVLTAFGATVRDETNLEQLTTKLMGVVEETLQPAHSRLWLKPAPLAPRHYGEIYKEGA